MTQKQYDRLISAIQAEKPNDVESLALLQDIFPIGSTVTFGYYQGGAIPGKVKARAGTVLEHHTHHDYPDGLAIRDTASLCKLGIGVSCVMAHWRHLQGLHPIDNDFLCIREPIKCDTVK